MLKALNYVIGAAQPSGLRREITETSPSEAAVPAANYGRVWSSLFSPVKFCYNAASELETS